MGAGGLAGGVVVVGYLARDSALGLRSFIRLCLGFGKVCLHGEIIGFEISAQVLVVSMASPAEVAQ